MTLACPWTAVLPAICHLWFLCVCAMLQLAWWGVAFWGAVFYTAFGGKKEAAPAAEQAAPAAAAAH